MPTTIMNSFRALQQDAHKRILQRRKPGAIYIQIGSATCEHAAGAEAVREEFAKHIRASGRDDIVLRRTGCTGRCSCEPIVTLQTSKGMPIKYGNVGRDGVHRIFTEHIQGDAPVEDLFLDPFELTGSRQYELLFCAGERCGRNREWDIRDLIRQKLEQHEIPRERVHMEQAQCFGLCSLDQSESVAHVLVRPAGCLYRLASPEQVDRMVREHLGQGSPVEELMVQDQPLSKRFFDLYGDGAFFNRQSRVALRNAGLIDPENLDEFLERDGFLALAECLQKGDPAWVIGQLETSRLRGRGGGGFPTSTKWSMARNVASDKKYLICNADEGDPGAFMDRSTLESDPFSVLEGMIIGGHTIGAEQGLIYVRAEYPLAIERLTHAIDLCRQGGFLGRDILGSGFDFDIEIRLGAGAFVCGEETALIHSIEGLRGQPRIRPPYPTESGLWGKPTVINNVETLANVPVILNHGGDWFARIGTEGSGGTKVFALAGKVRHTGLIEVPMGTSIEYVVNNIGGGPADGRRIKAVQIGGPAGGCIPAHLLDTPIDFDSLRELGAIMGSGGMIVLDEDNCMVDVAKFFLMFSQDESCGKCTPCREGTTRMLEILIRITEGKAEPEDLENLERLARLIQRSSLCGLGRAAPNPVLSTIQHFRHEYEAHINEKRCPSHKCRALIHYEIDPEKCVGCTVCAKNCPVSCIAGERRQTHVIDQSRCIRCGRCFEVCRFDAVQLM